MRDLKKIAATLICVAVVAMTLTFTVPYIIDIASYDNQINMTVKLKSNTTGEEYIADYSWLTDRIIRGDINTRFEWKETYSEANIRTENYFTSIFKNYATKVYIEWNDLQISRSGDWNFLVTFNFNGVEFSIECEGSSSKMNDIEALLNSDSFIGLLNMQLSDAGLTGIEFTVSFSFEIAGSYLESGFFNIYEDNQRFSNINAVLSEVVVGKISVIP